MTTDDWDDAPTAIGPPPAELLEQSEATGDFGEIAVELEYDDPTPADITEPDTKPHDVCPNCSGPTVSTGAGEPPTLAAMDRVAKIARVRGEPMFCYRSKPTLTRAWWYSCRWHDDGDRVRCFDGDDRRVPPPER